MEKCNTCKFYSGETCRKRAPTLVASIPSANGGYYDTYGQWIPYSFNYSYPYYFPMFPMVDGLGCGDHEPVVN